MKSLMLLAALLAMGACATAPDKIVTRDVRVPVAINCAIDAGPDPGFVDTHEALAAAANVFEKAKLLLAGRDQRDARIAELHAATAGCKPP